MDADAVRSRIEDLCPVLDQIRDNTRSASISIGVLHHGQVIFTRSRGFRDVESQVPADDDTNYLLCSLSKAFTASCCGILVDEGKMEWAAPLQTYIPFANTVDPVVGQRATLQDSLSHNTGLAHMDLTWLGVECTSILQKEELLEVVSHLPPIHDLRSGFHYNNYMYAVAGLAIEERTGHPWFEFLKHRILDPLKMLRTRTRRTELPDDNFAEPHVVLDDYSLHKQKPVDAAADNTLMGPAGAVWSCVSDMMIWAKALLDAIHNKPDTVLKQVPVIVSHKTNITSSSIGENTYGLGFARAMIPTTELGMLSLNGPQRQHVIGRNSRPRLVLYHNGEVSAQRTKTEYDRYARLAAEFGHHRDEERGKEGLCDVNLTDYVGKFTSRGLRMTLKITRSAGESLVMVVNNLASQHHELHHFSGDKLGFLPSTRREFVVREFIDWFQWDQFVLSFDRNIETGKVVGVRWALQVGLEPVQFHKVAEA
ncbi:hypothetical protein FGADI_2035 [Fusarium gaditjirri]|uniref:Beta-lactamase-related domain-containing protein n=1 Tax=Fusarium gaditjirri TaxID=282569 RepID=A0A8H4TJD1_9HYPO|nr:hypothetical protein FGADI_2035 [Fusarium gaditjirri]